MKYLFLLLCVLSLALASHAQSETCMQNQDHPGYNKIVQTTPSGVIEREYILYLPADHDAAYSLPLIINLHGFGDCASDFADVVGEYYKFNELADKEDILVAYPQGAYRPEKEDNYWEPGDDGSEDIYENDIYFIERLVDDISDHYNIDRAKVYVIGYSNGGMMAYSLACNSRGLFSAIGIMSGTMLQEECTVTEPVPIIKFHGIADEILPYEGSIWYQSVSDVVDFWLNQNDIPQSSRVFTELSDGKVEREQYTKDDNTACLSLYSVIEEYDKPGDHVWFSDSIEGETPNEIIWDFFSSSCNGVSNVHQPSISKYNFELIVNEDVLHVSIDSEQLLNQKFSVYDMQGNLVISSIVKAKLFSLDIKLLSPGVYVLELNGVTRKFVKSY